jgi:hypothetical protein
LISHCPSQLNSSIIHAVYGEEWIKTLLVLFGVHLCSCFIGAKWTKVFAHGNVDIFISFWFLTCKPIFEMWSVLVNLFLSKHVYFSSFT